jgi:dTMP kinase
MRRAPFISLDGLDGTGKSTQCRLLAEWLRGRGLAVTECADPGSTPVGDLIRDLLLDHRRQMVLPCEAFLFMASRAQLVADVIGPALEAGKAVVCDRYLLANVVYQGHAGGLPPERLWEVGRLATGNLEPDLTLVLDLPVTAALDRRARPADRMESRDLDYQERVRRGFLAEARRRPEIIKIVDARQSVADIQQRVRDHVAELLRSEPTT